MPCSTKGDLTRPSRIFKKHWRSKLITPTPHNGLGFAVLQKGRLDQAISHFEKALELKPTLAAAHNNLGMLCSKADDWMKRSRISKARWRPARKCRSA